MVPEKNTTMMDARLLLAAASGDATTMKHLALHDPAVLLGTTPVGNTCLHIASMHGHDGFCMDVMALNRSLLSAVNKDGETPLVTAVTSGRTSTTLASSFLRCYRDLHLSEAILMQDKLKNNSLHHAIRSGHRELALELIAVEPALSKAVNKYDESPMFMAVMRNFEDVLEKLLEIPDSAHVGVEGNNALHAAVTKGNSVMAKRVIEARPGLVREENEDKRTPMHLAVQCNKIDVLRVLLEHDPSLGYLISTDGSSLLCIAASKGSVGVAQELLRHCPDPPFCNAAGSTCLHIAVSSGQADFVRFVVRSPQLQHLVNLPNDKGDTAQQLAARNNNNADMAAALHFHAEYFTSGMTDQLMEAAVCGRVAEMKHLYLQVPDVLAATTPQGNTCLHIAAIHGHEAFCRAAQVLKPSLLAAVNSDGETPLLAAVASGRVSVASVLLSFCRDRRLRDAILVQDSRGNNALHHAIRNEHGQRKLALELIAAEPALSRAVNQYNESPMLVAMMRNCEDVLVKLLEIPDSAHVGSKGDNVLHAVVRNGNSAIAKKIMETRPALATEEDKIDKTSPLVLAAVRNKIDVLRVLLEHDRSLGYVVSSQGIPLLVSAAYRGHVGVAREILRHCPDAPLARTSGWTCLHQAVWRGHMEFVDFVLGLPQSRRLINMRDKDGNSALHLAVEKCNPKLVTALLLHPDIDVRVFNNKGVSAIWKLHRTDTDHSKTLNWNEVSMLILKADPQGATDVYNLRTQVREELTQITRKDIKSLTQTYTGNTSLVAILIATITFAAAFTLPGGYSTSPGDEGHPIMSTKFAFKAFLVSDTMAMCSSLVVAFVCIIARWEDLEFLLHYRSFTKKLMWFAYMATTIAFATGLYTVLAPRLLWLAIAVCVLMILLPILTKLLGEWPILRLRFRLGRTFKSELLDMV